MLHVHRHYHWSLLVRGAATAAAACAMLELCDGRRLCACPTSCVNVAPSRFLETAGYCLPSVARPDIASQSALHLGGACVWRGCAIRFFVWFVSWVQCRAWWAAPDKCILYLAALLPIAVPAVAATGRLMFRNGLRALLTLRNIGERPVWLPMVCRPLPKMWIWWTHVQLGRFYRASWPRWLMRCFVCYMLLFSYGMINPPHVGIALTHCIHKAILNVVVWSTSSSPEPLDPRAEDPHIAHCT